MTSDRDSRPGAALRAWLRALEKTAPISANPSITLPSLIDEWAITFSGAPALIDDRESLSYRSLADRCNRYARWALDQGIAAGEVVCLLMPNSAEYMAIWLGITRIGGVVSLLNTNLVGSNLAHTINIVAPKHIIAGAGTIGALVAVLPQLAPGIQCWGHSGAGHEFPRLDREIELRSGLPLDRSECRPPSTNDRALLIYTSGTTGLPKAANVSHFRLMQWSHWFAGMMDAGPSDRMYNCLPMYHSVGGVVATGAMLVSGGSVVLRRRFAASRFWDDVTDWDCTLFQYIGELCRYLVNSRAHRREADHRIRLCCGNGLRPDIWQTFQQRFRIPQILEFYAATEANFALYNCDGKPGAIGRIPSFIGHRSPVALIKLDLDTGEPVRNEDGFCVQCSSQEAGEAIGRIVAGSRFEGYTDEEASKRKVLRNVFVAGDAWFRTGDLMRKDRSGYYYFVDRIGDTFRWKGENVSTTEVAETLCACPGVTEAIVYGVAIPGNEGRAGMAAIVAEEGLNLTALRHHLAAQLPQYARPLFVRLRNSIETTGTFKPRKQDLAGEGYDPALTNDSIYFDDRTRDAFVKLDRELFESLQRGQIRL
ncbi:MAG: long-chain-acyl-CoA synthetase [Alphaproteobacteria bacterium]|nr:long-chain-acyl-CoA synthetase [Alphaproteobacteria bacterium]